MLKLCVYVRGEHFDGSVIELQNAARLLARFHQIFAEYPRVDEVDKIKGDVYPDDFDAWQAGFGTTESASHGDGDADDDGDVDGNDFVTWQREYGVGSLASAAIPEPSTLILCSLLTFPILAVARWRVRRRC